MTEESKMSEDLAKLAVERVSDAIASVMQLVPMCPNSHDAADQINAAVYAFVTQFHFTQSCLNAGEIPSIDEYFEEMVPLLKTCVEVHMETTKMALETQKAYQTRYRDKGLDPLGGIILGDAINKLKGDEQ